MKTDLQRAALDYVSKGFAIFPLAVQGKTPLTKNGVKDASNDPSTVQEWWDKNPNANIGLATGQVNNIVVIDMDVDEDRGINGYDSIRDWERTNGALPDSWRSITGRGGYHLIYSTDEKYKNRVNIIPGVDIRADGGYIVVPPSIHPNGTAYMWEDGPEDTQLCQITDTVRLFLSTGAKITSANKLIIPEKVSEGSRNDTMFRIACSLQSKGLSDDAIFAACSKENEERFDPPLGDREITTIINGVVNRFNKGAPIFFDAAGEAIQGRHEPQIERNNKGIPLQTIENAREAIEYDEQLYGKIRYNEIAYAAFVVGALPWDPNANNYREWNNFDDSALKAYIENKYALKSSEKCMEALNIVMAHNKYNPVVDVLTAIHAKWDGQFGHIRKLLPKYLGAEDSEYTYEVMKVFMLGAISRAYNPGCKFDYMPVLIGPQGCGKSTFLRYLCFNNAWFTDNFNTIDGDKAAEKLRGKWILEMAELLATKKAKEVESIKAFITSTTDDYRPPYMRRTEQRPRRCVFAGTTNNEYFLTDRTGNRRFLPIEANIERQEIHPLNDSEALANDINAAWAEAMELFERENRKPKLILPQNLFDTVKEIQSRHVEDDPRFGIIQNWLDNRTDKVCATEVWVEALGNSQKDFEKRYVNEIHQILGSMPGWVRAEKRGRCGDYGIQIYYSRTEDSVFKELPNDGELPF